MVVTRLGTLMASAVKSVKRKKMIYDESCLKCFKTSEAYTTGL